MTEAGFESEAGARLGRGLSHVERCARGAANGGACRQRVGNDGAWSPERQLHSASGVRNDGSVDMVHPPCAHYINERVIPR